MKRSIITIDEAKCTGCGLCIPGCPEGAIQIIDGKARLVSDLMCDGLGACLGTCPEDAITVEEHGIAVPAPEQHAPAAPTGRSELTHWPVQMHLIAPGAPHFRGSDLVLAADCVAYALGDFHSGYLKGKTLAIACPKLDEGQEIYLDKLKSLIDDAKTSTGILTEEWVSR